MVTLTCTHLTFFALCLLRLLITSCHCSCSLSCSRHHACRSSSFSANSSTFSLSSSSVAYRFLFPAFLRQAAMCPVLPHVRHVLVSPLPPFSCTLPPFLRLPFCQEFFPPSLPPACAYQLVYLHSPASSRALQGTPGISNFCAVVRAQAWPLRLAPSSLPSFFMRKNHRAAKNPYSFTQFHFSPTVRISRTSSCVSVFFPLRLQIQLGTNNCASCLRWEAVYCRKHSKVVGATLFAPPGISRYLSVSTSISGRSN